MSITINSLASVSDGDFRENQDMDRVQCDYVGRTAHNCQSWAINWLAQRWSLQGWDRVPNDRPWVEKDRTRTRHNILEACSGCQHFMLVVSGESTCGRNCNSSQEMHENRAGVLALLKKVLERRSSNNRAHQSRGEVLCACAENKGNYLQHIMTRNWKQNGNGMWNSSTRTWGQAFYCPL